MKELKKPVLRSRVNVPTSCASSKRLLGDLSRGCCFLGRAGELPERPSPPSKVEAQPGMKIEEGIKTTHNKARLTQQQHIYLSSMVTKISCKHSKRKILYF